MSRTALLFRSTLACTLAGFSAGGVHAAVEFFGRPHILEFQAGEEAGFGERFFATLQAAAIEGSGWGLVGLAAAIFALLLSLRASPEELVASFASHFLLLGAAFFGWLSITWAVEDALPFLGASSVLLLDAAGFLGAWIAFQLFVWGVRRIPRRLDAARRTRLAATLASVVVAGLWLWFAQSALIPQGGASRSALRLGMVLLSGLAGIPLSSFLAGLLETGIERFTERVGAGPILPRRAALLLGLSFLGSVGWSLTSFQLSASALDVRHDSLDASDRGEVKGPNVVFVTVDTLRADHLSCYGYGRPTSPFLDTLAAGGTRFADPVSAAAWTKPATGTLFTGLYPSRHGALYYGSSLQLPDGERTVAEAFRDAGYVTAGFVSNPNVKAIFDFDRGFDAFFDSPVEDTLTLACIRATWFGRALMDLLRHQFNWKYENDIRRMNKHVAGWLQENADERFFLYIHYIDPHIPYDPPSPWRDEFTQDHGFVTFSRRKELVGLDLYDAEIRYTDEGLRELVALLRGAGVWEDTLFVLTSDHGEEFFEHEVLGHGFSLYQPVVGVPLILHGAGVAAGVVVDEPVAIVDLPATVLELAGVGSGSFGDGESFAAAARGETWSSNRIAFLENEFGQDDSNRRAFVFTGARSGRWKLVLTEANAYFPPENPDNDSQALYDLETDPGERNNLIEDPAHRELVRELLDALQEHSRFLFETGFRDVEPAALSDDIRANLEALGY